MQAIEKLMFDLSVWRCSPELKVCSMCVFQLCVFLPGACVLDMGCVKAQPSSQFGFTSLALDFATAGTLKPAYHYILVPVCTCNMINFLSLKANKS